MSRPSNLRRGAGVPILSLVLVLGLATARPAAAVPCALDEPPAATLLLPYFEVDLDGSRTTLLSIGNATAAATLTRVTLWSDVGVPVFWFDLYLTGWDVETINLRDTLAGQLPQTAPPLADPVDEISPRGELSEDGDFPNCAGTMPPASPLPADFAAHLGAALTGEPSPLEPGTCYGFPQGDGVARGWVTVDVVERCNTAPPGALTGVDPPPGTGFAMDNVLWGDFLLVDPVENRASGGNLLRLEAAPGTFGEGDRTFYSSRLGSVIDQREPLPTVWATRFVTAPIAGGTTTGLLWWRDPGEPSEPFACTSTRQGLEAALPWFPLDQREALLFDEEENLDEDLGCVIATICPPVEFLPFPIVAGRVGVASAELPTVFDFGWWYFDLGLAERPTQSWIGALIEADGRFSATLEATPLDEPCAPGLPSPLDE